MASGASGARGARTLALFLHKPKKKEARGPTGGGFHVSSAARAAIRPPVCALVGSSPPPGQFPEARPPIP